MIYNSEGVESLMRLCLSTRARFATFMQNQLKLYKNYWACTKRRNVETKRNDQNETTETIETTETKRPKRNDRNETTEPKRPKRNGRNETAENINYRKNGKY